MARPTIRKSGAMTPTEYQRRWREGVRKRKAAEAKRAPLWAKQQRRAERERVLGERQLAMPEGKFGVIVEDFEWDFEVWSRATGMDRHAANHYPVAADAHTAEEIVRRTADRFEKADDNCVLFMWTTVPYLAVALDVLRLRCFRYVSHYVWGKDKAGTGYWSRNQHEVLLIGVKGEVPAPAPGMQWRSLIMAPIGAHSAKPEQFLAMIETYFPTLRKLELNARGPARSGWERWGNEAEVAGEGATDAETATPLEPCP